MRAVSKRVLAFWIVVVVLAALAGAWFHGWISEPSPQERAREEAERIKERVRDFTH